MLSILVTKDITDTNCTELGRFLEKKDHPIYPFYLSKFIKNCDIFSSFETEIVQSLPTMPKWGQKYVSQALFSNAKIPTTTIEAGMLYSDFLKTQKDKIDHLLKLIEFSNKNSIDPMPIKDKLFKIAPRLNPAITNENKYVIAKDFEKSRDFTTARKLYRELIKDKTISIKDKIQAYDALRLSYNLERDKPNYLKETISLVNFLKSKINDDLANEKYFEYSLILARIYWTQDNFVLSKKRLQYLLQNNEISDKYKAMAYFSLGGIFEDEKKEEKAISYYTQAYELFSKSDDQSLVESKNESLWNISWYYYKLGKYQESFEWITKYSEEKNTDYKFIFWKGIIQDKLNLKDEALTTFKNLQEEDSFGFYGQISHLFANKLEPLKQEKIDFEFKEDALSWAIYLGNHDLAQDILEYNPKAKIEEYLHASFYHKMIFKYFSLSEDEKNNLSSEEKLLFSYPLAYEKQFKLANKSELVPEELLMSIARQESAFNPYARSHADAFGLLQLIPSQAKRLSTKLKFDYVDYNDLYDVEKNISLSSLLLEELIKKHKGNFVNFVASYNAGEAQVYKWRKRNPKLSELEFIEQIPYKETRGYVKLVMRNFLVYKRLLSETEISLDDSIFILKKL